MKINHIKAIMAISKNGVIGQKNEKGEFIIPWKISEDMKNFRRLTTGNIVVMGWNTWTSLPDHVKPLPGRTNIVLSRQKRILPPGVILMHDVEQVVTFAQNTELEVFIMGGAQIYEAFDPYIDEWHLTMIGKKFQGSDFISLSQKLQANFLEGFGGAGEVIRWEKSEKNEYPAMYEVFKKI